MDSSQSLLVGESLQYIWMKFGKKSAMYPLEWLCRISPHFKEKFKDLKFQYQPGLDMWAVENRPKLLMPEEELSSGLLLEEIAKENNIIWHCDNLEIFGIDDGIEEWAQAPLKFQALAKLYIFALKYILQVRDLIIDEVNDIITDTKRVPHPGVRNYLQKHIDDGGPFRPLISSQPVKFIIPQELLNNLTSNPPKDGRDFIMPEHPGTDISMIRWAKFGLLPNQKYRLERLLDLANKYSFETLTMALRPGSQYSPSIYL